MSKPTIKQCSICGKKVIPIEAEDDVCLPCQAILKYSWELYGEEDGKKED